MGIDISARCDGCIAFHVMAAIQHGATQEETLETVGIGLYMGEVPPPSYGAIDMEAFNQVSAA